MGKEIERKFLLANQDWQDGSEGKSLRQGYLCLGPPVAVRVRVGGGEAVINVKKATVALTRDEFEYAIPLADAEEMLAGLCVGSIIEKVRYKMHYKGCTWEIDVFHGANAGLLVAEVELESEDQPFEKPPWLGREVSHDPRYLNTHLSLQPYTAW